MKRLLSEQDRISQIVQIETNDAISKVSPCTIQRHKHNDSERIASAKAHPEKETFRYKSLGFHIPFIKSLILAQDERWRRA